MAATAHDPPASITVVGGDVHNAYVAEVSLGRFQARHSRVHQVVCSPFRNPLGPAERRVVAVTKTRAAAVVVGGLARLAGVPSTLRAVALPGRPHVRQLDRGDRAGRAVGGRDDLPSRARIRRPACGLCIPGCSPMARERPLRSARNRPPAEPAWRFAGRLACSTTAPRRSAQPPNAIAQSANQAHPSVSPATTSDTQCRSSSTRLQATATASPTATPTRIARALGDRRRPASSASAANSAAAVDECPLGNEGPRWAASGSMVGRDRSTMPLMVLVTNESPSVTASRNTGIQRFGTRIHSTTPTMTAITITPRVDARLVTASRKRRVASPVWWCAQRAAPASRSESGSLWCISTTNSEITTPARHSMHTASVRARPVSTSVSRRLCTNRLTAVWARSSSATARVGCRPAGRRSTGREIAHAIRPATIEMISSAATGRTATSSSQVFARTRIWETCLHDGHRRIPTGGPAHRDTAEQR